MCCLKSLQLITSDDSRNVCAVTVAVICVALAQCVEAKLHPARLPIARQELLMRQSDACSTSVEPISAAASELRHDDSRRLLLPSGTGI
jgi:hypothetical protein